MDPNSEEEMRTFAIERVPQLVMDSRAEITIHPGGIPEISRSDVIPCFSISEIASDGEDHPVGHFKNYLRSDCSVSYTHLDVYKRQHLRFGKTPIRSP